MAITFLTGFEAGVLSASGGGLFVAAPTNSSVQGTTKRNGDYALRVNPTGAVGAAEILAPAAAVVAARVAIRFGSLPGANCQLVTFLSSGTNACLGYNASSGKLCWTVDAATPLAGSDGATTIAANTWYVVDVLVNRSTNKVSWTVKADGGSISNESDVTNGSWTGTTSQLWLGNPDNAQTRDVYYDDVLVGTAAGDWPFGDGSVVGLRPGSDGTHSFTANDFLKGDAGTQQSQSATDLWTMLDDNPWATARSTTDSIGQRVLRATSYCEIKMNSPPGGMPDAQAVRALLAYSSSATSANSAACIVRNSAGTATTVWGTHTSIGGASTALSDYSESSNFFKGAIVTAPGAGWSETEINAIRFRIGAAGDISPIPTWQAVMLEVAYPAPSGTTWDGDASLSFTMTSAATGAREAAGSVSTVTFAMTASATAIKERTGSATMTFAMTASAAAIKERLGVATASFTMASAVTGTREKLGSATTSFAMATAVAGAREAAGSVSTITFAMTASAAGDVEHFVSGAATVSFSVTIAAAGERTATGSASTSFAMAITAAGERTATGAATTSFTMTTAATGIREATASAASSFTFGVVASANIDSFGAASLSFHFTIVADSSGDKIGAVQPLTFAFTGAAAGERTATGSVASSFVISGAAAGTREAVGSATLTTAYGVSVVAERTAEATALVPFTFASSVTGTRELLGSVTLISSWTISATGAAGAPSVDGVVTLNLTFAITAEGDVRQATRAERAAMYLISPFVAVVGTQPFRGARGRRQPAVRQAAGVNPSVSGDRSGAGGARGARR